MPMVRVASSRPAGHCPVVTAPVKGARTLASLRDGASAPLDCPGSSQETGAYQGGSQQHASSARSARRPRREKGRRVNE
jgi:hypothetical protein